MTLRGLLARFSTRIPRRCLFPVTGSLCWDSRSRWSLGCYQLPGNLWTRFLVTLLTTGGDTAHYDLSRRGELSTFNNN